jgi:preprotein translocase subunit SecG
VIFFVTVLHVMVCVILVVVVLLQRGKGAEIGAVFGGGASSTVFGSRGAGNFLTKLTSGAAVVFMLTSLFLSYQGSKQFSRSIIDEEKKPAAEEKSKFAEPPAEGKSKFAEPPKSPGSEAKQTLPSAPAEKPPAPAEKPPPSSNP